MSVTDEIRQRLEAAFEPHLLEIEDEKLKGLVEQMAFDPAGNWLLAAGGDHGGFVTFYDTATGKMIHQEKAPMHVHEFAINEAAELIGRIRYLRCHLLGDVIPGLVRCCFVGRQASHYGLRD